MILRDVRLSDIDTYIRMRCDPAMMTELGGPQPREEIPAKVAKDVTSTQRDEAWIKMIIPDVAHPEVVAGTVVLWSHPFRDEQISETGWMVLPEFQGRGIGKTATRMLLEAARSDGRWGIVNAFPATTNGPSNGICKSLGFELIDQCDLISFTGGPLHTNRWVLDLKQLL